MPPSDALENPSEYPAEELRFRPVLLDWSHRLGRWLFRRGSDRDDDGSSLEPRARFRNVCISREAGAGGGTVARLLGTRLKWKVYDHELLEAIAHGMEIPTEEARAYDELAPSLIQDWLLPLREEHYAPQEAYLDHLAKLVQSIGRAGESILVGRGASFLPPRNETLSVRLVAPIQFRARRLSERLGVSVRTARRAARDLDRRSARFIRALHRADPNDPHIYDLVLDTQSLGLSITVDVLATAVESGRPRPSQSSLNRDFA
jgi:cytidylate kinase